MVGLVFELAEAVKPDGLGAATNHLSAVAAAAGAEAVSGAEV